MAENRRDEGEQDDSVAILTRYAGHHPEVRYVWADLCSMRSSGSSAGKPATKKGCDEVCPGRSSKVKGGLAPQTAATAAGGLEVPVSNPSGHARFGDATMLAMNDYDGHATLVLPDGCEKVVRVGLRIFPASLVDPVRWNGTIDADRKVLVAALESPLSMTLRMPDGREGQVLVDHVDDEVDEEGACWASLAGVGDAQFGSR